LNRRELHPSPITLRFHGVRLTTLRIFHTPLLYRPSASPLYLVLDFACVLERATIDTPTTAINIMNSPKSFTEIVGDENKEMRLPPSRISRNRVALSAWCFSRVIPKSNRKRR
jgi:hypothetical protein